MRVILSEAKDPLWAAYLGGVLRFAQYDTLFVFRNKTSHIPRGRGG